MKSSKDKKKILKVYNKLLNGKSKENSNFSMGKNWFNCHEAYKRNCIGNDGYYERVTNVKCYWDEIEEPHYLQCKVCKLLFRSKNDKTK